VAYITLAHLIWREVATDAPALPFMSDEKYREMFPQPDEGLSELGQAAVRAMVEERVLIDISHMSDKATAETFDLLDELDPGKRVPVLSTHAGWRFGSQEYMHGPETLARLKERDGVVGLIFASHQLADGEPCGKGRGFKLPARKGTRFARSFEIIRCHIDRIHDATGSYRHVAIGSDLDGFIKPTLPGLEDMRDMGPLESALREHYGDADAQAICSENALRLLRSYWRGASGS
jgi:membrane dipeptidase